MLMRADGDDEVPDMTATVQAKYGAVARRVAGETTDDTEGESCCGSTCCGGEGGDPITSNLYSTDETSGLPETAVRASLGCGNPTALATLEAGGNVRGFGAGGGVGGML